jgi:hypothetical protein
MTTLETDHSGSQGSLRLDESLSFVGAASSIGAFELDFASGQWALPATLLRNPGPHTPCHPLIQREERLPHKNFTPAAVRPRRSCSAAV